MKKQVIKMITLLAFSTVLMSGCAMEYQGHRRSYDKHHHSDGDHNRGHDRDHDYHHYNNH